MLEGLTPPERSTTFCKVSFTAEQLEPSDKEILLTAVDSQEWSAKALSKALKERGIQISDTTLLRHRQRHCSCS